MVRRSLSFKYDGFVPQTTLLHNHTAILPYPRHTEATKEANDYFNDENRVGADDGGDGDKVGWKFGGKAL